MKGVLGLFTKPLTQLLNKHLLLDRVIEHFSVPSGGRTIGVLKNARLLNTTRLKDVGLGRPQEFHYHALRYLRIRPGQQSRRRG